MNHPPVLTSIRFYPIKSCGAVFLNTAYAGPRGLESGHIIDRSWMIVDQNGVLVSQREKPALARVGIELLGETADRFRVAATGIAPLVLDAATVGDDRRKIIIHGKETVGHLAPQDVHEWFSRYLGEPVQVVHQKQDDVRLCDPNFALHPELDSVSFADGFPYLVTTEATLAKLNLLLDHAVAMSRFRPNLVFGATAADAEYGWEEISFGAASLSLVKPCTRCVVTTIDQITGEKTGNQPLATLAQNYFLSHNVGSKRVQGAVFGENAIATIYGRISVGDEVYAIVTKPAPNFRRREPRLST